MGEESDRVNGPLADRLDLLARTPEALSDAVDGLDDAALSRRAGPQEWTAKDVICHLRDVEELGILRFHSMLAMDEPKVFAGGSGPSDRAAGGFTCDVPF